MNDHVEWMHPNKGRIVEEVCAVHCKELLDALSTLGIYCIGTESNLDICWRCIYAGYPFRTWMDKIDMESIL